MGLTCFFSCFSCPHWLVFRRQCLPPTPRHSSPGFSGLSTPFSWSSSLVSLALAPSSDRRCGFCVAAIGCWASLVDAVVVWVVWVVVVAVGCSWWWLDVVRFDGCPCRGSLFG